jgi:septal ring factor EnvC (AmiA/AmiB activator)
MENNNIFEGEVKKILGKVLNEEVSKVSRQDFNRVQFKIEELQNSLTETTKELRKLQESIPGGLKSITNGRLSSISSDLSNSQKLIGQLKDKIRQFKRTLYLQTIEEKKK